MIDPSRRAEQTEATVVLDPPGSPDRPTVRDVREHVQPEVDRRSTLLGLLVFAAPLALYAAAMYGVFSAPWWPLQIVCGILAGSFIGTMFITGHDACHGSLTPYSLLNRILGRIAFLPSLTPYTSWKYAHNQIHHSFTNLRGKDYAWAPYSVQEFAQLSPLRRMLERHYRTLAGFSRQYQIEYWWKRLMFPSVADRREINRPVTFALDRCLVALFLVAQVALTVTIAQRLTPGVGFWSAFTSPWALLIPAIVIPFDVWCGSMSFCVFQHHNHPRSAWYSNREEWDFFAAHVEGTVHIKMPLMLEWATASIMQHTAHHVNPKVPLYRLHTAQHRLETVYPEHVVVERWSPFMFFRNLRVCKLYDYDQHRWLDFNGQPTTEPHPLVQRLRSYRAQEAAGTPSVPPIAKFPDAPHAGDGTEPKLGIVA